MSHFIDPVVPGFHTPKTLILLYQCFLLLFIQFSQFTVQITNLSHLQLAYILLIFPTIAVKSPFELYFTSDRNTEYVLEHVLTFEIEM